MRIRGAHRRPTTTRPAGRASALFGAVLVLTLLAGCSSGGEEVSPSMAPTSSTAPSTTATASPLPSPSSPSSTDEGAGVPASSAPPASPSSTGGGQDAVTTGLDPVVFSGYESPRVSVVPWELQCDGPIVTPESAVTMGTAEQDLSAEGSNASTARQVAVLPSVDAAVEAAQALGAVVDACAGPQTAETGFEFGQATVEELAIGAQGRLLSFVFEDGVAAVGVFRRGNAVALVRAGASPEYVGGRTPEDDVRAGAGALFRQMCAYEEDAC